MRCSLCGRKIAGFKPYLGQQRAYHTRCAARLGRT